MMTMEKQSPPGCRTCGSCKPGSQAEFSAEMIIHFLGVNNLTSQASGYIPSFWSAWIAVFLASLPRRMRWGSLQRALLQVNPIGLAVQLAAALTHSRIAGYRNLMWRFARSL